MVDVLKWIVVDRIAGAILVAVVVMLALVVCAAVIVFIWSWIIERPIKLFGAEVPESGFRFETGLIDLPANKKPELYDESRVYSGERFDLAKREFAREFREEPAVVLGLVKIDGGVRIGRQGKVEPDGELAIVRLEVHAVDVTRKGFTVRFETWDKGLLYDASVSWIAIGRG